jgi:SAM-dependent methyltransferase
MSDDDEYGSVADLYDYVTLYQSRGDIDFYVDEARASGGPVLEIGCGTGRVLIPVARAGVSIVGLDSSPSMLRICETRLHQESESVRIKAGLVRGDMRDFTLPETYRLVTVPFRPFQHLVTVEDQLACLESIRRHLVQGGRLILDLFNPWLEALAEKNVGKEFGAEAEFTTPDGRRVIRTHKIVAKDHFNQTNQIELIYYVKHSDGREERLVHAFPMRHLFRFEAEHLLVRCGFDVENVYADHRKNPYGSTYPGELIFVAKKR